MKRIAREVVIGTALAITLGAIATAALTPDTGATPQFTKSTAAHGGAQLDGSSGTPPTIAARPPASRGEKRLLMTFEPFAIARESTSAYSSVTLPQLGRSFPKIGFIPGDRASQSPGEVSVFVPTPETLILATRDTTGCTWLHEFGAGPEVAHTDAAQSCAGATPPNSGWSPIAPA